MESQRAKRAIKPPKKYMEEEGGKPQSCAYSTYALCFARADASSMLMLPRVLVFVDEQPAGSTPEAEQPIFVYRLLKKKEVNKDLVHQEVYTQRLCLSR